MIEPEAIGVSATPAINEPNDNGAIALIDDGPPSFDEAAESEFRAEARVRGEVVPAPAPAADVEETDSKNLPSLDTLVQRIPTEVREALDDLFRARFVRVQRVPRKALKS